MERKSISVFSADDWKKYIDILNKSKTHNSDYMVFLKEPEQKIYDIEQLQRVPINLYDLFVWQHHYAAKDNGNKGIINKVIIIFNL